MEKKRTSTSTMSSTQPHYSESISNFLLVLPPHLLFATLCLTLVIFLALLCDPIPVLVSCFSIIAIYFLFSSSTSLFSTPCSIQERESNIKKIEIKKVNHGIVIEKKKQKQKESRNEKEREPRKEKDKKKESRKEKESRNQKEEKEKYRGEWKLSTFPPPSSIINQQQQHFDGIVLRKYGDQENLIQFNRQQECDSHNTKKEEREGEDWFMMQNGTTTSNQVKFKWELDLENNVAKYRAEQI